MQNLIPPFRAFVLTGILLSTLNISVACNYSTITLLNMTYVGAGQWDLELRMCVPGGCDVVDPWFGCLSSEMNDNTGNFAIEISGGGATIASYPGSIVSPMTGASYSGALGSTTRVDYSNPSSWYTLETTSVTPTTSYCNTFTIRTNGYPSTVCTLGMEGADFWYSYPACTGKCISLGPLSVNWLGIEAVQKDNDVIIEWQTASETDNDHFVVERSADGGAFEAIGEVPASKVPQKTNAYSFKDLLASGEDLAYRVKAVNKDRIGFYSKVSTLHYHPDPDRIISIFPQPAAELANIAVWSSSSKSSILRLINTSGHLVKEEIVNLDYGYNEIQLGLNQLPKGYFSLKSRN